ncbi:MAG TPA: rod shape-determining protein MreC [Clostridiales bacterium]|nr:rod shape-determining protein MreC [Clostridiales bacterium]
MSFFKHRYLKIVIILLVLLASLMVFSKIGNNPVQNALNSIISPVFNAGEKVVTPVRKFVVAVKNANSYEAEIEELKKQVNALKIENRSREEYIVENRRLKELLSLKDGMQESRTITARVISYEPNSWYDTIMINKGENAGISKDNAVITGLGVVGKVTQVGRNWAKVSTLINISDSVGVKLARTGDIGVVSGDAALAENKQAKLEYMSNDKKLINGDILLTSGLGGIYPSDLSVGKVTEIHSDSAGNLEYATIEPSVDFSSLYEVLVITYHNGEWEKDNTDEGVAE